MTMVRGGCMALALALALRALLETIRYPDEIKHFTFDRTEGLVIHDFVLQPVSHGCTIHK